MNANTQLHMAGWAAPLAAECQQARHSIIISALSCLPPRTNTPGHWPALWQAWADAAARGIAVTLYLPMPTNHHGATVQNLQVAATAAAAGLNCRLIKGPQLLHCKSVVIDRHAVWIGSGNFTAAACHHNHEAYMRADCPAFAERILARWEAIK